MRSLASLMTADDGEGDRGEDDGAWAGAPFMHLPVLGLHTFPIAAQSCLHGLRGGVTRLPLPPFLTHRAVFASYIFPSALHFARRSMRRASNTLRPGTFFNRLAMADTSRGVVPFVTPIGAGAGTADTGRCFTHRNVRGLQNFP